MTALDAVQQMYRPVYYLTVNIIIRRTVDMCCPALLANRRDATFCNRFTLPQLQSAHTLITEACTVPHYCLLLQCCQRYTGLLSPHRSNGAVIRRWVCECNFPVSQNRLLGFTSGTYRHHRIGTSALRVELSGITE
jgi:hypothetical protein